MISCKYFWVLSTSTLQFISYRNGFNICISYKCYVLFIRMYGSYKLYNYYNNKFSLIKKQFRLKLLTSQIKITYKNYQLNLKIYYFHPIMNILNQKKSNFHNTLNWVKYTLLILFTLNDDNLYQMSPKLLRFATFHS